MEIDVAAPLGWLPPPVADAVRDRTLLRRAGLAAAALSAAHAMHSTGAAPVGIGVALAAAALVAALVLLRAVRARQEAMRRRLAEVEALLAAVAVRDHELHNLVAGLSGAARVLTGPDAGAAPGGRELLAAVAVELERLRRLLVGEPAAPDGIPAAPTAVGPLLHRLALVHRVNGLDVELRVDGDPHVDLDGGALAQVLANLLGNCARHAPGARVRVHAAACGPRVCIEVADDGPGWPAGSTAQLLGRGVRGPGSTGSGLGLAVCAEVLERHHGSVTLVPGAPGCAVLLELPAAGAGVPMAVVGG